MTNVSLSVSVYSNIELTKRMTHNVTTSIYLVMQAPQTGLVLNISTNHHRHHEHRFSYIVRRFSRWKENAPTCTDKLRGFWRPLSTGHASVDRRGLSATSPANACYLSIVDWPTCWYCWFYYDLVRKKFKLLIWFSLPDAHWGAIHSNEKVL